MERQSKTIENYRILQTLGEGGFSKVKLAFNTTDQKYYAIKIHRTDDPEFTPSHQKTIRNEVDLLTKLETHPNILSLTQFFPTSVYKKPPSTEIPVSCIVVLRYISGGELFGYIANSGALSEEFCRYYFKQLISGLRHMHSHGICHRDMKPDNILVDENFDLVIADFGFAAPDNGRDGKGVLYSNLGTEAYKAPEIHNAQEYYGPSVDLFATAIVLFIMRSSIPPFMRARSEDKFWQMILSGKLDLFWKFHSRNKVEGYYSSGFKDIIMKMLSPQPSDRLSIEEILAHEWMQGPVPTKLEVQTEFTKRKARNDQVSEEERKQRVSNRAQTRFRGKGDDPDTLDVYFREARKPTEFFTTADARDYVAALKKYCEGFGYDFVQIKEQKHKYLITATTNPYDCLMVKGEEDAKELEDIAEEVSTKFQVKILRVSDDINCVQFMMVEGVDPVFKNLCADIMKEMREFIDADYSE